MAVGVDSLTAAIHWLEDLRETAELDLLGRAGAIARETRAHALRDRAARRYFRAYPDARRLRLGAAAGQAEGWLDGRFDLSRRLPFEDSCFDEILIDGALECLEYAQGCFNLRECRRVLKPSGRLRVVTHDLAALLALYRPERTAAEEAYLRELTDRFLPGLGRYEPVFVVNLAMRFERHRFLYDAPLLEESLREAGFGEVERGEPRSMASHQRCWMFAMNAYG